MKKVAFQSCIRLSSDKSQIFRVLNYTNSESGTIEAKNMKGERVLLNISEVELGDANDEYTFDKSIEETPLFFE
ncbi:hypothetical protein [Segatella paludivivens]|uniref:hypothetical protein n=1 Tax=Segatella paludivivens TaxID=185294 RepID=UPI00035F270A|nr:hypothetical protein [Segatella paludivivens]